MQAERAGEPFLLYRNGRNRQVIVKLTGDRLTIGRDADMDVVITWDRDVSRIHAELQRAWSIWLLVDDGLSRNGTWVGDHRVESRRPLHDGDRIRIGSTTITYRAPAEARIAETNVGLELTESFAMLPTAAVSGFYFGHAQAEYFGVARIGQDQVADYATRRGVDLKQAERWLRPNLD